MFLKVFKTPQYLAELIPKTVGTRHTHNTSNIIMDWNFSVLSVDKRFK
jgi:hypothetical protein